MTSRWIWPVGVSLALSMLGCSGDDDSNDDSVRSDIDNLSSGSGITGSAGTSSPATGGASGASGASAGVATGGASGAGMGTPGPVSFQSDIWPLLRVKCAGAGCHGDGSFLPEHANSNVDVAYEEAQPVADRIAGRVSGQLTPIMPQGCGPAPGFGLCLSLEEVALIRTWVSQGAPF